MANGDDKAKRPGPIHASDVSVPRTSGPRAKESLALALSSSVRAALMLAQDEGAKVQVVLRGDPAAGRPVEMIEGVVKEFRPGRDGRERVVLAISEDANRVVPVDSILRVAASEH